MTDSLHRLLDPYQNIPPHLSAGPLRSAAQVYGEDIPPTPTQESLRSQLAALDSLLDRPAPANLRDLVATATTPAQLAKEVAAAAAAQTQAEWLQREAGKLRASLTHAKIAANSEPAVYAATVAHLSEQIGGDVAALQAAAREFGEDLLGKTDTILERDAVMVERTKRAVVGLASLTRIRVAGQASGDHLRTVAIVAELDPETADGETLTLAAGSAKKSQGLLLGALVLGLIPGLTLSVAPDWETVQQRRQELDELRKRLAEGEPVATIRDHRLSLDSAGF